jgi:hypothetical protein
MKRNLRSNWTEILKSKAITSRLKSSATPPQFVNKLKFWTKNSLLRISNQIGWTHKIGNIKLKGEKKTWEKAMSWRSKKNIIIKWKDLNKWWRLLRINWSKWKSKNRSFWKSYSLRRLSNKLHSRHLSL